MHRIIKYILLSAVLVAGDISACLAETPVPDSQAAESFVLDSVKVSARKTEEDVQKIPVSATVLSGTLIEEAGIDNTMELTRFAPNVYMKKSTSENVISMRGVTSFESSIYSPTAVYVDDLMVPLHYSHWIDLIDIERVEVLRGPQGSLYGGNSLAGVINVITRQPDNQTRMKLYGDLGFYTSVDGTPAQYDVGASVSGPLVRDKLYLGASGLWKKGNGFGNNLNYDDDKAAKIDHKNARATLRWTPTSQFDISFTADVLDYDDGIAVYRFDSGPYRTDPYEVRHDNKDYQKESGNSQNLRMSYAGESLRFLSVSGRRDYSNDNLQDYDSTADPQNNWGGSYSNYDDTYYSQEFRLSSNNDKSPFKWLLGAYGFKEDTDIKVDNEVIAQHALTNVDTKGYAVFGQGIYTLFERLHLTAGLRYDVRRAEGKKRDTGVNISDDISNNELLPKFSVGYDISDTVYSYATVSKGFLAGGFNYGTALDKSTFTYDPEYTWNYEVGLKTEWLNRRLQVNLAVFYIQMTDKQVTEMQYGSGGFTTKVDNAAKAHSKGVELELRARPALGWDIIAGFGYTDAKIDDWIATEWKSDYSGLTRNDYSGKKVPGVPEFTGNLGVQYQHVSGFFARTDLSCVGPIYADQKNRIKEDAYALVNLRLGYKADHYEVVLWGKNIFDTKYHTVFYDWDGAKLVQDGDPALFGIRLTLFY